MADRFGLFWLAACSLGCGLGGLSHRSGIARVVGFVGIYFALEIGFFKFHEERKINKKLLLDFFENNFMYTDAKSGSIKEFKNFEKHVSDAAKEEERFKIAFIKNMYKKLEEYENSEY